MGWIADRFDWHGVFITIVRHDLHLETVRDVTRRFPDRARADGRYYALDCTRAEIRTLHATERFSAETGKAAFPKRFPVGQGSLAISTLEEELPFIQGLNRATGKRVGIYLEIKQPAWHRREGRDLSRIVRRILDHHGYRTKDEACIVQCFEHAEVRRLRGELGWQGWLIHLLGSGKKGGDGTDFDHRRSPARLMGLAHAAGLLVHPYTVQLDELPHSVAAVEELHRVLFEQAKVDGVSTDFPDVTVKALRRAREQGRPRPEHRHGARASRLPGPTPLAAAA